ncbi:Fur family transcriptional regulator, partial [Nocardia brasiliensis]|uniref:Fur family transcriptional regulator n=1 Tax=Nocardia brasiliensis TaxID=37326 RepID=UPI003CC7CAE1
PAGWGGGYDPRTAHTHHLLGCRRCGTVVDIDCVVGAAPCLEPDDAHGFAIDEAEVVFWGLCPQCRTSTRQES